MTDQLQTRRTLLAWLGAGAAASALAACGTPASAASYKVNLTDAQWRKKLTKDQYFILREAGTEPAFSSPLLNEHRKGTFLCAGCDNALFDSKTMFHSGTGWPSFYQPLPGAVGTSSDFKLGYPRVEVHCADCGGHLGHVFKDGPKPTGLRYCMDGDGLKFRAAKA
ncbi:MAG TPA: peptide-methionine (R)-S-oxide reductase MsrB [Croceibacterium sp.]|jgi:peptide-methionine (R)-S-oxide reductase